MKVSVFNKFEVRTYEPIGLSAIIRISDSYNMPILKGNYDLEKNFYFRDTEDELSDYSISEEEANELASFIKKLEKFNEIVVHCDYGKGRSPAVASVICEYYILYFNKDNFPNINNLVVKRLRKALNLS